MSNVSRCFFCVNKKDYDPKYGYFGCNYSGQECKEYSMFEPKAKPKPMTNADRIRAMTDEELANWLANGTINSEKARLYWLDWLQKEVTET